MADLRAIPDEAVSRIRLVETHCHLDQPPLVEDAAGVVQRAQAVGVDRIVAPSVDRASWAVVAGLAGSYSGVWAAYGLHPWYVGEALDLEALDGHLGGGAVAVGEIGLDTKVEGADPVRQRAVLEAQLALASDLGLPVILHCRGAFDDLVEMVTRYRPRGVVHAFSRGPELAERLIALGLHLGFGGAVTRPRARRAQRSAQRVPLGRIVLETDAPSIGLDGVAPEAAEPRNVADVARTLAALRGVPFDEVARVTTEAACELFGLR